MNNLLFDEILKFTPNKGRLFKDVKPGMLDLGNMRTLPMQDASRSSFSQRRIYITVGALFCLIIVSVLTLLGRSISMQVINNGSYIELASNNKTRKSVIIAERGVIYDNQGQILARNKPSFALEFNTTSCRSSDICEKTINSIKSLLPLDETSIKKQIESGKSIIILASGLQKEQTLSIEANLYRLPGVSVVVYPLRDYTYSDVFAHSLGYVGLDDQSNEPNIIGKSGIEETYNQYLSGIPGSSISEVDSTGQRYTELTKIDSLPGKNITTYLNKDLNVKAYELLKKTVEDKKATAGVVVAQDPSTGGVLALVSYPAFDPNKMSVGLSSADYAKLTSDPGFPFFNRAISATYAPGSTFKLITASAALSEGTVTKDTTIFDKGYIQVGSYIFHNWKLNGHGDVNLVRALQVSNDTYFYTLGGGYGDVVGVGIDKLHSWATKFGYGSKTGIDINGEVSGYIPDGKSRAWYLGDTYISSIGQGDILATPLQVNNVTAYFANGGFLFQPALVKSIEGVNSPGPKVLASDLISKTNYDLIRQGLKAAVLPGGTGYPLFDFPVKHPGIELAGKTGTSEYIDAQGKPGTHALFTVFGPVNKPTIALTVFLEAGGAGSDDAAPIARQLLDVWFK